MTTRKYSSRSQQTTLTGAITAGATAMTVVSGTALLGGVTIPAGTTFTLVLDPDTAIEEIVDATAVSTNTFTITRAIDGSTAQAHSAGGVVRHMAIGRDYRDANLHTEADSYYNDGSGTGHTMHGINSGEGVVVGTLKTQTLTNKTLTSPTITDPTITGTASAGAVLVFEGATADAYETTLTVVDPTQDNTVTIPNTTGTVVLDSATQTLTNKTLTSPTISGSPVITGLSSAGMISSSATPKDYVDSILGSATAAATSAASAATSAASAATSATSAAASATASAASASASATSATAAATSATSAAASATAAATSATSAAASATAAATSATSAAASATTAANSVASIATYATNAANSATAAATSATSAAASATAAATSATSAAASATAAATSASSASTSASSALTSANSAAVSAASAAAAVTTAIQASIIDAKGDLIAGTANDTVARLPIGTNGQILTADSAQSTGIKWADAPAGYLAPTIGSTTITSGTTVSTISAVTLNNATLTGTLTAGASSGTNGQLLTSTGTGVQWAAAPVSLPSQTGNTGKLLTTDGTTASWAGAAPVAQTTEPTTLIDGLVWLDTDGTAPTAVITRWQKTGLAAGTTSLSGNDDNSLPLTYTPGYEQVFLNGALLSRGNDYTATSGTSITLTTGVVTGDLVEVICATQVATTDTYTQTQSDAKFTINANNGSAGKNAIINGAFDIWQRGTSFTNPGNTTYTADRWCVYNNGNCVMSQETTVKPDTSTYSYKIAATATSADNAIFQLIEQLNMEQFRGKQVTLSVKLAGTAGLVPGFDFAYSTTANDTLTNTGTAISTTTIANPAINPSTFVTWSITGTVPTTAKTLRVGIHSNSMVNTNVLYIAEFQIELGSVATAFARAGGTIQGELAACQRYYWRNTPGTSYGRLTNFSPASSTTNILMAVQHPVPMRTNPTSVDYANITTYDNTNIGGNITAVSIAVDSNNYIGYLSVTTTSLTQYRPYQLMNQNNTAGYLGISAEL